MSFSNILAMASGSGSTPPPSRVAKSDGKAAAKSLKNPTIDSAKTPAAPVSLEKRPTTASVAKGLAQPPSKPMPAPSVSVPSAVTPSKNVDPASNASRPRSLPSLSSPAATKSLAGPPKRPVVPSQPKQSRQPPNLGKPRPAARSEVKDTIRKKASFLDIMKKAETVDSSKLKVTVNTKDAKTCQTSAQRSIASARRLSPVLRSDRSVSPAVYGHDASALAGSAKNTTKLKPSSAGTKKRYAPAPTSRPFPELAARLQRKQAISRDQDSDLDDFIVDDTEVLGGGHSANYNRDEIWGLFNKKPRTYYDEEDSEEDMEVTGAELFEEEKRSAKQAKLEDAAEERRLQQAALLKSQRKKKILH